MIISMTMLLKAYLKLLYGLSEEYVKSLPLCCFQLRFCPRKCSKFVAGKKSAVGDKPAVKRNEKPISWVRLPFATAPLLTSEDVNVQQSRVSPQPSSPALSPDIMLI